MNVKTKVALIITVLIIFADIWLYTTQPLGEDFYIISDWVIVIYSLAAVTVGFYAFRLHGMKSIQGKALFFMIVGGVFWLLGEFFWAYQEVNLGIEIPTPSIADLFWFIGYPLFGMGLYHVWKITRAPVTKSRKYIISMTLVIILMIAGAYGAYPTITDPEMTLLEKGITLGYIVVDFILIVGAVIIILSFWGGKLVRPWLVILLSIIVSTFADIMYAQVASLYESGSFFGILWDIDYILAAFGFFYYRQTMKDVMVSMKSAKKRG